MVYVYLSALILIMIMAAIMMLGAEEHEGKLVQVSAAVFSTCLATLLVYFITTNGGL